MSTTTVKASGSVQASGSSTSKLAPPQPPLALLVIMATASPLALNAFVPAMPTAMADLNTSLSSIQLSFTLYLFTLAFGQLLSGQLADAYGRRPVILVGFCLHLIGSLLAAVAGDITQLLSGRVLQALGGAASLTLARAVLLDTYGAKGAASRMGYLIMAIAVSQALAPTLGGYLNLWIGWNSIFYLSVVNSCVIWLLAFKFLPETSTQRQRLSFKSAWLNYRQVLASRQYLGYVLTTSCLAAAFYLFVGSSPYVVVNLLRGSSADFGTWFLWVSGAFVVGGYASTRIATYLNNDQTIVVGNALALLGAGLLLGLAAAGIFSYISLFLPMAVLIFGRGLSQPNAQLAALSGNPEVAATASGLMGFIQLFTGALIAQTVPFILQVGVLWVFICIATAVLLSCVSHYYAWRIAQATPAV